MVRDGIKKQITIIGLTGCFGSGKTTCAMIFKQLGAVGIDADKVYHRLLDSPGVIRSRLVSAFGQEILTARGKISRKKLGQKVFADRNELNRLSKISHPLIIRQIKSRLRGLEHSSRKRIAILDAPLLIEAGLTKMVDILVVVYTTRKLIIDRMRRSRNLSLKEINRRIGSQTSLSTKVRLADYVINNSGSRAKSVSQIKAIWKKIVN